MDWKAYYANERRGPGAKDKITHWLREARRSPRVSSGFDHTVLSFPHTALDAAGPLQAAVVDAVYRSGRRRVIALGVLHTSPLCDAAVAADLSAPVSDRARAFERLAGGFLEEGDAVATPFGPLTRARIVALPSAPIRQDKRAVLQDEFSLDTFFAVLRLGARVWRTPAPQIMPIYVGLTRNPISGSFAVARNLADWLHGQWNDDTAIVATGDVIHYGSVYGSHVESSSRQDLDTRCLTRLREMFRQAFEQGDDASAYRISRDELKSDQREMLPVLSSLLDSGACGDILEYGLTDYADILHVSPPCWVASALIAYARNGEHDTLRRPDGEWGANPRRGDEGT